MVSSFSCKVLREFHIASQGKRGFIIQSLRNYDARPCPQDYAVSEEVQGVNIIYSQLTPALTCRFNDANQLFGVWFWTKESEENAAMYERVFSTKCGTIDLFYSDIPLQAVAARA